MNVGSRGIKFKGKKQIKNGRKSNQTEVKVSLEMKMHVPLYYIITHVSCGPH